MTPIRWLTPFAVLTALTGPAGAEERAVPLEEWRALTDGRTVVYHLDGELWGREFFHPGGGRATFLFRDGACMTGAWTYADGLYCFAYSGLDCFRHLRRDGRLVIVPEGGGATQTVEAIESAPISCGPALSS